MDNENQSEQEDEVIGTPDGAVEEGDTDEVVPREDDEGVADGDVELDEETKEAARDAALE